MTRALSATLALGGPERGGGKGLSPTRPGGRDLAGREGAAHDARGGRGGRALAEEDGAVAPRPRPPRTPHLPHTPRWLRWPRSDAGGQSGPEAAVQPVAAMGPPYPHTSLRLNARRHLCKRAGAIVSLKMSRKHDMLRYHVSGVKVYQSVTISARERIVLFHLRDSGNASVLESDSTK